MDQLEDRVASVRRFSRFYTRRIGVLHEGLLGSPLSVTADSTSGLVNANNLTTDPSFVDPDGADNVLGYAGYRVLTLRGPGCDGQASSEPRSGHQR